MLVSVGSDKKIWLYDGKTGEPTKQVGEGEHTGSIFGVAWAKDSRRFVTASADQTVKIWDAEAGKCVHTWRLGEEGKVSIPDQQVGVCWPRDGLVISVDLEGNLNYLSEGNPRPAKVIRGHQKAVTAIGYTPDSKTLWTGSSEGRICAWNTAAGSAEKADGSAHSNYVSGLATSPLDGRAYSVGWDDTIRTIDVSTKTFVATDKTSGQPKGIAVSSSSGNKVVQWVVSAEHIDSYVDGKNQGSTPLRGQYAPTCIAAHGNILAVGAEDKTVRLYTIDGTELRPLSEIKGATSAISTLSFSDSNMLAAGLSNGKIFVYASKGSGSEWELVTNRWSAHTARVTSISWSPDGKKAVSGALDTSVYVWSLADPGKRVKALNAHKDGVGGVVWAEEGRVISCGADAAVKVWKVAGVQ